MNHAGIRSALSRIAWAYLLIHLHFRLNNLDVLPDWAGYLLIFSAIGLLAWRAAGSAPAQALLHPAWARCPGWTGCPFSSPARSSPAASFSSPP